MQKIKAFILDCQDSSQKAYSNLKGLLQRIESSPKDSKEFKGALQFLHALADADENSKTPRPAHSGELHFSFKNLTFEQQDGKVTHLRLLQLPSTFTPEEWSFTFFEGLTRYPVTDFQDKLIAELGCGLGWITIALAKHFKPEKIYGLDINPKAILSSKINLYLNGFDSDGIPTWTHQGKSLDHFVEFHTSNLLEYCQKEHLFLDRVIGCIPQVLNPDREFASKIGAPKWQSLERANDEFLHSLSNYTPNFGYVEDQFGLGLISKAVEESASRLRSGGKTVFNLGGRPGHQVLSNLFLRRGFQVRTVWQTLVGQAEDTEIQSLVQIEEDTPHRFEFFVSKGSHSPISAKTAQALSEAGGEIYHALTVMEATPIDTNQLPRVLTHFSKISKSGLDLSYRQEGLIREKVSFLEHLIETLAQKGHSIPYGATQGLPSFRSRMASFLKQYHGLPFREDHFLVFPNRQTLFQNTALLFDPKCILIASDQLGMMSSLLRTTAQTVYEAPRDSEVFCGLLEKLRPDLAIYHLAAAEARTWEVFANLCKASEKSGTRLIVELSDLIELSSAPSSNGVFRLLSQSPLPPHLALSIGLVKNQIYQDLEVCFLVSQNLSLLNALESSIELTFSRTSILSQLYYEKLIQDLIHFHISSPIKSSALPHSDPSATEPESPTFKKVFVELSAPVKKAFQHPAIALESAARVKGVIRLDYGENNLPTPKRISNLLLESFAKKELSAEEIKYEEPLAELLSQRYRIAGNPHLAIGGGVAPLFAAIAKFCSRNRNPMLFPSGAYGHFTAASHFFGCKTQVIPTSFKSQFKLTADSLQKTLKALPTNAQPFLALTAPLVNPTGAEYNSEEILSLCDVLHRKGGTLILDTVFSGLNFKAKIFDSHLLNLSKTRLNSTILLGGVSKEFAAGGLRVGYAAASNEMLAGIFRTSEPKVHSTLKTFLRQLTRDILTHEPTLKAALTQQRDTLKERARTLSSTLSKAGWAPLPSQGGLFLCATPKNPKRIHRLEEFYREKVGVVINPPHWTGIPGYFRFVLSTSEADFSEAIERIKTRGSIA